LDLFIQERIPLFHALLGEIQVGLGLPTRRPANAQGRFREDGGK
jgi:hypothetical protein